MITFTPELTDLVARNALFVINHSGGKDSQAMYALIADAVPADQIMVIHAHLPEVEWEGVIDHIKATIDPALPFIVTKARKKDGSERTLFNMVEDRGYWPSPTQRQCTSDLKRGPIEREVRAFLKDNPQFNGLVVNCMGLRAEESSQRAKAEAFKLNARNSKAGREWYDWLPIHEMLIEGTDGVWDIIKQAGQTPHWAYAEGMTRLSCCFCIMSSKGDLERAAMLNPKLYARVCATERAIDQTFLMPTKKHGRRFLDEVLGFTPAEALEAFGDDTVNLADLCAAA